MSLGSKSMATAMKLAWFITKLTGIAISKTSSVILKLLWIFVSAIGKLLKQIKQK